jgi:hypothetical protein
MQICCGCTTEAKFNDTGKRLMQGLLGNCRRILGLEHLFGFHLSRSILAVGRRSCMNTSRDAYIRVSDSTCLLHTTMGVLLSLPLAGGLSTIATSCLAGLAFCFTSTAGQSQMVPILNPKLAHKHLQLLCFLNLVTAIPPLQLVLDLLYDISCSFFQLETNAF